MCLLYLLVDHGVYDADSAVDAEGEGHLLVHAVEVRVRHLVDQLTHTDDP